MESQRRRIEQAVVDIQDVFLATPDASLTTSSLGRHAGVDADTCAAVLAVLVDAGVVDHRDGAYHRKTSPCARSAA